MSTLSNKSGKNQKLVDQYESLLPIYKALVSKLEILLSDIMREKGITVHSIVGRYKNQSSLAGKLSKKNNEYTELSQITDLAGLRIITYFPNDVDKIAEIIQEEFELDITNSVDKRTTMEVNQFGYLSLHYIASFTDARCKLIEYKSFQDLKFEVQIRSILQHAWAEIEHDLGYKAAVEIPKQVRRRFARVAGLLELADQEFESIKQELESYREDVSSDIKSNPDAVLLDKDSIAIFVTDDLAVKRIDRKIVKLVNGKGREDYEYSERDIVMLSTVGLTTIAAISKSLAENEEAIVKFAKIWLKDLTYSSMLKGISLFYLWYVMLGKSGDIKAIKEAVRATSIGAGTSIDKFAQSIVDTYQQAMSN
jgi:putative GTP pyrophosphokinase